MANDFSKMSDEELEAFIENGHKQLTGLATQRPEERNPIRKVIDYPVDVAKSAGTAFASSVGKTVAGAAYLGDVAAKGGEWVGKTLTGQSTDNLEGNPLLRDIGKQTRATADFLDKTNEQRGGFVNNAAKFAGTVASMPGSVAASGAQAAVQYVNEGDNLLSAGLKMAGGVAAAKGTEKAIGGVLAWGRGNQFARGIAEKVSGGIDEAATKGQEAVRKTGEFIQSAVGSLKKQTDDIFATSKAKWANSPVKGWDAVKDNSFIKQAGDELSKVKQGDSNLGELAKVWQNGRRDQTPTAEQADALLKYMNTKSFSGGVVKPKGEAYKTAAGQLSNTIKTASPEYAKTMEMSAPLIESQKVLRRYIDPKTKEVNFDKIVNSPSGQVTNEVSTSLKRAGVDGSEIVQGYFAKQIEKSGSTASELPVGPLLKTLLPNRNVVNNLQKLVSPEDAATLQVMWQLRIARDAKGNSLDAAVGAANEKLGAIGKISEFIKEKIGAGDQEVLDFIEKGTAFSSKTIRQLGGHLTSGLVSTQNKKEEDNQ